jgi:adenine-specific DNA glycosylase
MELGATVCTPQTPSCHKCPLKVECLAYQKTQKSSASILNHFVSKKTAETKMNEGKTEIDVDIEELEKLLPPMEQSKNHEDNNGIENKDDMRDHGVDKQMEQVMDEKKKKK